MLSELHFPPQKTKWAEPNYYIDWGREVSAAIVLFVVLGISDAEESTQ